MCQGHPPASFPTSLTPPQQRGYTPSPASYTPLLPPSSFACMLRFGLVLLLTPFLDSYLKFTEPLLLLPRGNPHLTSRSQGSCSLTSSSSDGLESASVLSLRNLTSQEGARDFTVDVLWRELWWPIFCRSRRCSLQANRRRNCLGRGQPLWTPVHPAGAWEPWQTQRTRAGMGTTVSQAPGCSHSLYLVGTHTFLCWRWGPLHILFPLCGPKASLLY